MESPDPQHYALLIGIDSYQDADRPLYGCVNDVKKISSLLKKQNFPPIHVQTFTATDNGKGGLVEEREDWPTHDNVVKALRDLRSKTKKNDRVYIHYSGHGTCFPPQNQSERYEFDSFGGVLALCLLSDESPAVTNDIRGPMLAALLNGIAYNRVVVTVVFDCCFSGRIFRHDQARQVRYMPHTSTGWWAADVREDAPEDRFSDIDDLVDYFRNVSLTPNWLIDPEQYTVLVACGPHQLAAEMKVGEEVFGKLSYHLYEYFKQHGLQRQMKNVYNYLMTQFLNPDRAAIGNWGDDDPESWMGQTPVLYGNKDINFFGMPAMKGLGADILDKAMMPVEKSQFGRDEFEFRVRVGEAHGFRPGDEFYVRALQPIESPLFAGRLKEVGSVSSTLDLIDLDANLQAQLFKSLEVVAEPRVRRRLHAFPVYLDSTVPDRDKLAGSLSHYSLSVHENELQSYFFHVTLTTDEIEGKERYDILDSEGNSLINLPSMLISSSSASQIASYVAHLANYTLVKYLKNDRDDEEMSAFRDSFDVYALDRSGGRFRSDDLIEVQDCPGNRRSTFEIYFENRGNTTLYVYFYALSPLWEVDHVHKATFEMVPPAVLARSPRAENRSYRPSPSKKLRTIVPDAMRGRFSYCDDVVKVIVTSKPTTFDILELPRLEGKREQPIRGQDPEKEKPGAADCWDAFSFPVRTTFQKDEQEVVSG